MDASKLVSPDFCFSDGCQKSATGRSSMRALAMSYAVLLVLCVLLPPCAFGLDKPPVSAPGMHAPTSDYADHQAASPNRRFAVRTFGGFDEKKCVLQVRDSGEALVQVGTNFRSGRTLWSTDSKAVVIAMQEGSSSSTDVKVFTWQNGKFVEQTLPELQDPALRSRDANDPTLFHWLCHGKWEPVRWKHDGSLVLVGHSAANGDGAFAHAWTILTVAPHRHGPWQIVLETHRYSNEQSGGLTSQIVGKTDGP